MATRRQVLGSAGRAGAGLALLPRSPAYAGKALCIAGRRHAMGGQQFAGGEVLLDTTPMRKILGVDADCTPC
jgi:FAD/FMN-containing dehydrogenase